MLVLVTDHAQSKYAARMRVFRINVADGRCTEVSPAGAGAEGALVWVNVGLTDIVDDDRRTQLESIGLPSCPLAYYELAARWYSPDEPQFERARQDFVYWDDAVLSVNRPAGPRMTRAYWIGVNAEAGIAGETRLGWTFVPLLAHPRWLITSLGPHPLELDEIREAALSQWRSNFRDGSDLGILIMRALADSYQPALERLRARLQAVEQAFVQGQDDPQNVTTLDATGFRGLVAEVKWAVDSLSVMLPPLRRPGEAPAIAWLDAHNAPEAADAFAARLEAACIELGALRAAISDAFLFATSAQSAEQLERARETLELTRLIHEAERERVTAAERSEARARTLQQTLTLVAAFFLGPGLVAASFGAFPDLLQDCQNARLASMLVLMAVSVVLTLGAVRWFERRQRDLSRPRD
jgi:hypothetical protein